MGTYLHFSIDGDITSPFIEETGILQGRPTPYHLFLPILFETAVAQVKVLISPPVSVVEGEPFQIQPIIQVLDRLDKPLANKMVFAIKTKEQGRAMPSLYSLKDSGYVTKELLFPIPAIYNESFMDPLKSHMFSPIFTNSSGIVQFTNLTFSGQGNAGSTDAGLYTIEFVCDGVNSDPFEIQVKSKVGSVKFIEQPPARVIIDPYDDIQLSPIVQVLSFDGKPIQGKVPLNAFISPIDNTGVGNVIGFIDSEHPTFSATGPDGCFSLIYRISILKVNHLKVKLGVTFDDIVVLSDAFELTYDEESLDKRLCTGVSTVNVPNTNFQIVKSFNKLIEYRRNNKCI